jgi:hypothetical protein
LRKVAESLSSADIVISNLECFFSNLECVLDTPEQIHSIPHEGFFRRPRGPSPWENRNCGTGKLYQLWSTHILGSITTLDKAGIPHTGAGANIVAARNPVIITRRGRKYGFLQRTSVYWPTDHAADITGAGVAPLPGHTAYEAPMYRCRHP